MWNNVYKIPEKQKCEKNREGHLGFRCLQVWTERCRTWSNSMLHREYKRLCGKFLAPTQRRTYRSFLLPQKQYKNYEFISDDWEKNNLVDAQRAGGWCEPVRHDHSVTHELLLEIAYQLILVSQSSRRRLPGVSGRSAMPAMSVCRVVPRKFRPCRNSL